LQLRARVGGYGYDFSFTFTGDGVAGAGTSRYRHRIVVHRRESCLSISAAANFNDGTQSGIIDLLPTNAAPFDIVISPTVILPMTIWWPAGWRRSDSR